jgi:cytidine deaminase
MTDSFERLYSAAREAREKSYSPYSGKKVGAAILFENGEVTSGANVENSSFGATLCAERVAISTGAANGHRKIHEVVVVTDESPPWSPCGICRQTIAEFGSPETPIHLTNLSGEKITSSLAELLPLAFTPDKLNPSKP